MLQTLSAVQSQLRDLEDENSISRRRVRELEMELEECKRHVARERTRLIEREELSGLAYGKTTQTTRNKGKGRAMEPSVDIDDERSHERYKEAVDEKKGLCFVNLQLLPSYFLCVPALEALISSLRSHLTRLTSELASHQDLLTELRNLRDSDSRALKEKSADIIKLREEVQRLAGEVEVLRGVIEEGLKERRASREMIQVEQSVADIAMSQDLEEEQEEGNEDEDEDVAEDDSDEELSGVEEVNGPFDPVSIHEESSRVNQADKTMRTDFATLGSTNPAESMTSRRFVDKEELERISAEVEERRSNRSSNSTESHSRRALSPSVRKDRRTTVEDEEELLPQTSNMSHHSQNRFQTTVQHEPPSFYSSAPAAGCERSNVSHHRLQTTAPPEPSSHPSTPAAGYERLSQTSNMNMSHHSQSRLQATTVQQPEPLSSFHPSITQAVAGYAPKQAGPARFQEHLEDEPETPFPQIRGEHLERLFFSAPEHNARTCTVCYRRRHRTGRSSPWSYPEKDGDRAARRNAAAEENEDEGFGEGSDEAADITDRVAKDNKGKQRDYVIFSNDPGRWRQAGRREGLPPQTVVARVIRELEDDFTHYKRYVGVFKKLIIISLVNDPSFDKCICGTSRSVQGHGCCF